MQTQTKPRARANQTATAVLGALSVAPMTGYALREAIRDVLGHFWSASFGQIYPTLTALERNGHIRRLGAVRTRASMFEITASGASRLKELLAQPVQPAPPRNGLMLRLFFGRQLGAPACRALVREARADAERPPTSEESPPPGAAIAGADQAIAELAPLDSHDEETHRQAANNAAPQTR